MSKQKRWSPTIKSEVEETLARHPEAQWDNRVLLLRVWELHGLVLTEAQWALVGSLPTLETVRRVARKLVNEDGAP